ncbi:NAD(P)/FAD-dependent oxidoreductase [Kibdelosporangium philippinense]|uniref:NAD(P)/FAD-dependent oxidoreductase n=1 Tax=Kibdelosporangium philippinense TaxID=211113 RepID=A0ABS8Z9E6_9PSEU|nr:NAD(P)/FAD-dependent oxidoreductase [Kibdelosporangium philippinense]MCE7002472.1 NAD(P)/FAD-dependent oxidoreductase [Kibdelosporangium philippinense]
MTFLAEPVCPDQVVPRANELDVVIIGAGFSGLGVAALLDRAGIRSFRILEEASDLGGVWRDNTYPGCACDIPSPLYSFSFDQKANWTRLFAPQPEILAYLHDVARRRGLTDRTRFGTRVARASWDSADARWEVETESGERYRARFLISAVGALHHPVVPDLPGVFAGPAFHSANWDHSVDLQGKRVAVIGTGASAIQFVPAIVDQVAELAVFQRTAPWIMPKLDRPMSTAWFPPHRWYVRRRLFWIHENRAAGFVQDPVRMAQTARYARGHLNRQVSDADLRARLTPDYTVGCKRLLISNDWYPALTRPHVSVHTGDVRSIGPDGVVAADGTVVPADVLIYGTGFDAHNNVTRMAITGRAGVRLKDAWSQGMSAYLGTTVAGFPNMFVMAGPNTGLGHNSQIVMIEAQARHIVDCVKRVWRSRARSIEVTAEAQLRFNEWVQDRMAHTVWESGGCRSWYQDPRTGRNTLLWPDTTVEFLRRTRRIRRLDFVLS